MRLSGYVHAALGTACLAAAVVGGGQASALTIDFEGLPPFLSPGASIPGITVSPEGGIIDEAGVSTVTGVPFPPGSLATSGSNLLGNLFGNTFTITLDTPADQVSAFTVGSFASGVFGTITMRAFASGLPVGVVSTSSLDIGDSGLPEGFLSLSAPGITSVRFEADVGGASSFLIDDFTAVAVPEASLSLLFLMVLGVLAAEGRR